MEAGDLIGALAIGLAAGVVSGMIGVGGGVLFVPGLVLFLDLSQIKAESTSLLAIIVVAIVGAWRQHGYGNLRLRDAILIGVLSPVGVVIGAAASNALPQRALTIAFAAVMLFFAVQLGRRALRKPDEPDPEPDVSGGSHGPG
jgi:uncharacterized membrane protein YfcA